MRYQRSVYKNYSNFLAQATEIAKDKVLLYNTLLDPPTRERLTGNAFQRFLQFLIYILKRLGWYIYVAIAGLLGLSVYGFFGGMGALLASNPVLAAAVVALGGGTGIYFIWKSKDAFLAHKIIGDRYKKDFEFMLFHQASKRKFSILSSTIFWLLLN